MGILIFLKDRSTEDNRRNQRRCLSRSFGFLSNERKEELLIAATLEGSLTVGDRLQFCNPDQGMDTLETVVVKKTCQKKDVESLRDEESLSRDRYASSLAKLKRKCAL